ncbi:MAG TPA: EAL domain-containing protein [Aestuariivirgaceae bacterium]|nr:EAL domain-containing protein [Aestuariivirgaceae bacterium]
MPERRSLAKAVLFCILCGTTLAAIGVSAAAAYDAIGGAAPAVAVALIGLVQLLILIGNWRRSAPDEAEEPAHVPRVDARSASELIRQDSAGDHWRTRREEPESASMPMARAGAGEAASAGPGAARPTASGADLLDQGQLDLHLEPIVELVESSTVYYRSSLALTRHDGGRLGPSLLSLSAGQGGFASALDLALFRRVCPVIRHLKVRGRRPGVFCPLSPQSFADQGVLDELVGFLKANEDAAAGMVIEISQAGLGALSPAGMEGLARLAELGATLSLSEARLEGPDPATLALLGFRFLDLDVPWLASIHGWDAFDEDNDVWCLARRAEAAGLTVIAANLAASHELDRVRPFARLARGSLFSPPRIVRRDIADLPAQAAAA